MIDQFSYCLDFTAYDFMCATALTRKGLIKGEGS